MKHGISPKELAEAIGVSESSVKRWVDQGALTAFRTTGGHRRIARDEAMRWLRDQRLQIVRPDRLGLSESVMQITRALPLGVAGERFHEDLVEGRGAEARGVLVGLFLAGHSVGVIADEVIRPAMSRIGTLWQHGTEGIFIEHRATDLCVRAVEELRGLLPDNAEPDAPVVVTAAPSTDPYLVAPMLASLALTEVGWRAHNLGPDTPTSVLLLAGRQLEARMLLVSVGIPLTETLRSELETLIDVAGRDGRLVALGGRFIDALQLPERPHLFIGRSLGELAAFGRGFVRKLDQATA